MLCVRVVSSFSTRDYSSEDVPGCSSRPLLLTTARVHTGEMLCSEEHRPDDARVNPTIGSSSLIPELIMVFLSN
jgi:hypothetical protein